jgi:hypothetical protein
VFGESGVKPLGHLNLLEFKREKKTEKKRSLNISTHAQEMMVQSNKQDLVLIFLGFCFAFE